MALEEVHDVPKVAAIVIDLLILACLVFVDFDDGFLMTFDAGLSLRTGVQKSNTNDDAFYANQQNKQQGAVE